MRLLQATQKMLRSIYRLLVPCEGQNGEGSRRQFSCRDVPVLRYSIPWNMLHKADVLTMLREDKALEARGLCKVQVEILPTCSTDGTAGFQTLLTAETPELQTALKPQASDDGTKRIEQSFPPLLLSLIPLNQYWLP